MLRNYVQETSNAPGSAATINLAGAPAGRIAWLSVFASGAAVFYVLDDGTQSEWGFGTVTAGSPNTLTRGTVLGNSAGTTARLNFTGATKAFNDVPAERSVYADGTGAVNLGSTSANGDTSQVILTTNGGTGNISAQVKYAGPSYAATTRINQVQGDFEYINSGYTRVNFAVRQAGGFSAPVGDCLIQYQGTFGLQIQDTAAVPGQSALILGVSNVASFLAAFFYGTTGVGAINTNGSTTLYGTTSDYRLKVVYGPAMNTGALIDSVPVYDAEMKFGSRRPMFLAHELQAVVPDAVIGAKDAVRADGSIDPQLVDEKILFPILWADNQAMHQQIAALTARIAALESRPPPT